MSSEESAGASIGDFVWEDSDMDGIQDPGEPGLGGVQLVLKDASGAVLATTTTGPDGSYLFPAPAAGDYVVEIVDATLPPGFVPSPCNAGEDDAIDNDCSPAMVALPTGDTVELTIDFGFNSFSTACTGSIGDFVFEDLNGNNLQDIGELGIEGIELVLADDTGAVIGTTTSASGGFYEFRDLCAGSYTVEVDPTSVPEHLSPVICDVGFDETIDSDCSPVDVVLFSDSDLDLAVDFGYALCGPCDGQVTALTLRYLGLAAAFVEVEGKESIVFADIVEPNGTFSFFGDDSMGTFGNSIKLFVEGLEVEKIHTSCSKPVGPGRVKGDFEVVAGTSKDGGPLCDIGDQLCTGDKPKVLTMIYTGADCSATDHDQDPSKVSCSGDPAFSTPVQIVAFNGSNVYFDGIVELGGSFDIDAANAGQDKLKSETFVDIFDLSGALLQVVKFHTSCSQPLSLGNQFGSLVLEGFMSQSQE